MSNRKESPVLHFLYNTAVGRICLKAVASRTVSKAVGSFMECRLSKPLIKRFVKKNKIELDDFYSDDFKCFNDCFTRRIKDGKRPVSSNADVLVSPCDALLSAYKITPNLRLEVKGTPYLLSELFENASLAEKYSNGVALVFRLCVNHYHRYIYIDDCIKGENYFIPGKLHTVRPVALASIPVFKTNCREYTVMHTVGFGDVTQMEVGALLVGKIKNYHGAGEYKRGNEKGMFLYGGSTVILFLENGVADIDGQYFELTEKGHEAEVVMGQQIGKRVENV